MDTKVKKPVRFRLGLVPCFLLLAVNDAVILLGHWEERWSLFGFYVPVVELAFLLTFAFGLLGVGRINQDIATYRSFAMGIIVGTTLSAGLYVVQAVVLFFVAMYGALGDSCSFSGTCQGDVNLLRNR